LRSFRVQSGSGFRRVGVDLPTLRL
jgi:hypothetical protein